jgi:hypothetical protein
MFDAGARQAISSIARGLGVEPAALLAVAEIESAGKPFAMVDGRPMPLIRWECHYFYRLLPPSLRSQGMAARLAHPVAGTIGNPASQQARYAMLARGRAIHDEAAISSCSWGLGQVMGAHWKSLGFDSPQRFMQVACSGIAGQTELMARFIKKNGLTGNLKAKNWPAFARAYNGPGYRANRYDIKMARAYIRYLGNKPPPGIASPMILDYVPGIAESAAAAAETELLLRPGSTGPAVRELQEILRKAGYFVYIDGHYGPATAKAVTEFQRKAGLKTPGGVDAATRAKMAGRQTDMVTPWWNKPQAPNEHPSLPQPQGKKPWWDTGREALPQQHGKKVWWDV